MQKEKVILFQKKILSWYANHKRDLPWRKTKDGYKILISEIMLQQTQVNRVLSYYQKWLEEFPDFETLAKAEKITVLKRWSGLGYNQRALRLQQLAQQVMQRYQGKLPRDEKSLVSLPGIGPYTAAALQAFAFNKEVPVIDTNVRRVLIHEFQLWEIITQKALLEIAKQCIPKGKSSLWHNALMDYGSLEKTAQKTGIKPLSQQSKFEGSDRQVRGWLIRQLIKHRVVLMVGLRRKFPGKDVDGIIQKMEGEGIVCRNGGEVML